jgi:S-adenosylmethionine:tRNA ribosyltransferase-isomerase
MEDHEMHAEYFMVNKSTIEKILDQPGRKIISVGTTSLRTIESLYWLGVKLLMNKSLITTEISQWETYELPKLISVSEALTAILGWMNENDLMTFSAKTQIIIAPGYEFKVVKGLITNFHQPQSTLLLLVSAFIGSDWRIVYEYALEKDFRFLSYGDGCLLWRDQD